MNRAVLQGTTHESPLGAAQTHIRLRLGRIAAAAAGEGLPESPLRGQLIRPLTALAAATHREAALGDRFWYAVYAVQLAHEASLVHDDIVDEARTRRSEPSMVAAQGVGPALVHGDHLLTAAYRVAARTRSLDFVETFSRAVERTVAGEIAQAAARGRCLSPEHYRDIALAKSGELLGCSLATAATVAGDGETSRQLFALGRRLGLLYQMLDDLLDYCPALDTGKAPLQDFRQRHWTWPLAELGEVDFTWRPSEVLAAMTAPGPRGSPLRRCLRRLSHDASALEKALQEVLGTNEILRQMLQEWLNRAGTAVERQEAAPRQITASRVDLHAFLRERVPPLDQVDAYLAQHSRSFRFAARLFPPEERERISRIYAYCRVTDDLVDRNAGEISKEALLDEWRRLSERAYQGASSELPLLDRVMQEAAVSGVPFTYASELIEGMRMDLRGEVYPSLAALRRYTHRVASVVGLWLTELLGVHTPWVLERAAALGHAMQLTNILRDVGEDARRGRLYLPLDRMAHHGVAPADLQRMIREPCEIPAGYAALVEELLRTAEGEYEHAFGAIPQLPPSAQRPVAVAAYVYRGIHTEIRRQGYDNLRLRASTSRAHKLWLAARALRALQGFPAQPTRPAESSAP